MMLPGVTAAILLSCMSCSACLAHERQCQVTTTGQLLLAQIVQRLLAYCDNLILYLIEVQQHISAPDRQEELHRQRG